jgi:hypothetical protein
MRTGKLSIVPASEYSVDSVIEDNLGKEVVTYAEISKVQGQPFDEKVAWFQKTCKQLGTPWDQGHMRICVRREHLLADSIKAVMSLGREDMKKIWRFEFMNEAGIDAGGLAKVSFLFLTFFSFQRMLFTLF